MGGLFAGRERAFRDPQERGVSPQGYPADKHRGSTDSVNFLEGLSREPHFSSPTLGTILPTRVHLLDQRDLLLAPPSLELLLATHCLGDFVVPFVVHQPRASYFLLKPSKAPALCCMIRRSKNPVTPVLSVPEGLAMIYIQNLYWRPSRIGRLAALSVSKKIHQAAFTTETFSGSFDGALSPLRQAQGPASWLRMTDGRGGRGYAEWPDAFLDISYTIVLLSLRVYKDWRVGGGPRVARGV